MLLIIAIILFTALLLVGCAAPKNKNVLETENEKLNTNSLEEIKPSKLAQAIIKSIGLRSGDFHIPETNVNSKSSNYESDDIPQSDDVEWVPIPQSELMSDGFTHTLVINHKTKRYWIIRMGGIAGNYERFGPFQFIE